MRVRIGSPGLARFGMLYPATTADAGPVQAQNTGPSVDASGTESKVSDLAMMLSIVSSLALLFRKG